MRKVFKCKLLLGCFIALSYGSLLAQKEGVVNDLGSHKNYKQHQDFKELQSMGYTDKEIYEDLGNAHFLSHKYETAIFWYDKLIELSDEGKLEPSYQKRYNHAVAILGSAKTTTEVEDENWSELVRLDYKITSVSKKEAKPYSAKDRFNPLQGSTKSASTAFGGFATHKVNNGAIAGKNEFAYNTPIARTKDGNTAYFSKEIMVKPTTGIFSKKQKVHRIYKAHKIDGQWKTMQELVLCPKNYSALHPAISADGKRLFFASNMPGTFGKYDIYVSNISRNGTVGIARNLGATVNTNKNDMYPKVIEGNTIVFASDGHKGYGGLDVFMVHVGKKNAGLAINLESPINSKEDEFSIHIDNNAEIAYVVSNRGAKGNDVQKVAFSFIGEKENTPSRKYQRLEDLNNERQKNYSSSVFED